MCACVCFFVLLCWNSIRPINLPPISIRAMNWLLSFCFNINSLPTCLILPNRWYCEGFCALLNNLNTAKLTNESASSFGHRICIELPCSVLCVCADMFAFAFIRNVSYNSRLTSFRPVTLFVVPLHSMPLNWMCVFENRFRIRHTHTHTQQRYQNLYLWNVIVFVLVQCVLFCTLFCLI